MDDGIRIEYASERKLRVRNKGYYRLSHWPIWITVFFLAPGPWTFTLFEHGMTGEQAWWLLAVLIGTGIAGLLGNLPGVEPAPYIIRFVEDKPNPLYRRICYTFAWCAVVSYALLNLTGLVIAVVTGKWYLKQIYEYGYFPIAAVILTLGVLRIPPRVRTSTQGEGHERRYFYGSVWAVCIAQPVLGVMWKILPHERWADLLKLVVFVGILAAVGKMAERGLLPRTRRILPGELAIEGD
jgi:hypothetical protein